jgi:hypothetical protein
MKSNEEKVIGLVLVLLVVLAGFGLTKIFDYIGTSNAWPAVVLTGIGTAAYFLYMAQTNGLDLRKAKNDARIAQFREEQRTIDVSKRLN